MFRRLACCALLALAAAPAAEAGGPSPGVVRDTAGVRTQDRSVRYAALANGADTTVVAYRGQGMHVLRSAQLTGPWGVPLVTFNGVRGGVSHDGLTLVLGDATPRNGPFRSPSRFAVLDTRTLRPLRLLSLEGDFSFDALSPNGRLLYLVQHVSASDLSRYVVRGYDLHTDTLLPRRVADPRQRGWVMSGYPVSRATSADGRWAYTLYGNGGGYPFVHALDTLHRSAVCIGIPWVGSQQALGFARLRLADGGRLLTISQADPSGKRFAIDTRTLRLVRAQQQRAAFAWATVGGGIAGGLALLAFGALLAWRRPLALRDLRLRLAQPGERR